MTALAQTPMAPPPRPEQPFPRGAGILLGLGLGGFFDGIVFHQILQWHHLLTCAGFPADSLRNLEINTLADGLFHASTYVFVVLGLVIAVRRRHDGEPDEPEEPASRPEPDHPTGP